MLADYLIVYLLVTLTIVMGSNRLVSNYAVPHSLVTLYFRQINAVVCVHVTLFVYVKT
jgi:hypothetical protein